MLHGAERAPVLLCLVSLLILAHPSGAHGRAFEVRLLKGDEQNGVWGTDEFQVAVNKFGVLEHVIVRDKELVRHAARLYAFPVPPGGGPAPRTVQGEGGTRALSVEPPTMETHDEKGTRVFVWRCRISRKDIFDGKPLCDVVERVRITPTGEIYVSYDFEWLETMRWKSFNLLIFPDKETVPGRDYLVFAGERLLTGKLTLGAAAPGQKRIREAMDQLTVWTEVGPLHFCWDSETKCSLTWQKYVQLSMTPPAVPRKDPVYRGQKDRISYRILLPVSQQ